MAGKTHRTVQKVDLFVPRGEDVELKCSAVKLGKEDYFKRRLSLGLEPLCRSKLRGAF